MEPIDSGDQKQNASDTSSEASQETRNPNVDVPSTSTASQPKPAKPEEYGTDTPKKNWLNKAKPWVELVGIVLLATYTGFTIAMYLTNREATDAATSAADAAERSVTLAEQSTHLEQRAWIGLDSTPQVTISSLEAGNFQANINVTIKNFGRGPALNVMNDSRVATQGKVEKTQDTSCNILFPFVGLKPNPPVYSSEDISKPQWGQVIFPNQLLDKGITYSNSSLNVIGTEAFIVGCIAYRDQFGSPHWTRYCYNTGDTQVVRDASSFGRLRLCSEFNYTDDVESKEFRAGSETK